MNVDIIPPIHAADLAPASSRQVVKPLPGTVTTRFKLENAHHAWPSGMKLKAVVTVVPEIAETMQFSQIAAVA